MTPDFGQLCPTKALSTRESIGSHAVELAQTRAEANRRDLSNAVFETLIPVLVL